MKKLLIIPMLFACYMSIGQTDSASIIGKSIIIGNLVIAQNNFPERMSWFDGQSDCEALGKGWRLPTKDELKILFQNRYKIGCSTTSYWSSTEFNVENAWWQFFLNGSQEYSSKWIYQNVRAVRTL
jgi:hypothetical protein